MTSRTRAPGRRRGLCRFALLLVIAWFGAAGGAEAAVAVSVVGAELRVVGNAAADDVTLSLSVDTLRVEVRANAVLIASVLRTTFTTIAIDAGGGDDTVLIDEVNGPFTHAHPTTIGGGAGNDGITGGAGAETIDGGAGNDTILGGRAADTVHGGPGDDVVSWRANALLLPTDGADIVDGDDGVDRLVILGSDLAETYSLAPNGDRALVIRGGNQLNIGTIELVQVSLADGDDQFSVDPAFAQPIDVHVSGGIGNDDITGGPGNDHISGGPGEDTIHGGPGNDDVDGDGGVDTIDGGPGNDTIDGWGGDDVVTGGSGDDRLVWYYFEGTDTLDGGPGVDTVEVHGDTVGENYTLSTNGPQIVLDISPGTASVAFTTTERLDMRLGGGSDIFVVPPSLATALTVTVDGSSGDDLIVGGAGDDTIDGGSGIDTINGGGGNDTLRGGPGVDSLSGGVGDDTLDGAEGNDLLFGDAGNDTLTGGDGVDGIHGGSGNDVVLWTPLFGDETIDGDDGVDTFRLDGYAFVDAISLAPDGGRVALIWSDMSVQTRYLDLGSFERIDFATIDNGDSILLAPGLGALVDLVTADLGEHGDLAWTSASSPPLIVDGGPGPDALRFDALNQSVQLQPTTISTAAGVRVTYTNFEDVQILNPAGALPTVTITGPTSAPATTATSAFVTLAGTVADDGAIVSVTWANDRGGTGTAAGTTAWTAANIGLLPGLNRITVSALDSAGNTTFDTIDITVTAFTYSLAEGATGTFFDLDVAIANPTTTAAPVTVTFLRQNGPPVTQTMTLPPTSQTTIHVDDVAGLANEGGVSTVVTSTAAVPLVVERTMFWDASHYGSHGGTAVDGPRTRWLFAEGSEGFFNTFVLLGNTGSTASSVTLTFLREGSTPHARVVTVPPNARVTVAANGIPELVGRSFSIVVDATTPIIAERAMYFGTARLLDGGHESAGVPEGATAWFLAEGATGSFFETFVLVGNPNPVAANVTFTFLTDGGVSVTRQKTVPANGRLTVNVEYEAPVLANAAVSTTINADQPVIAERAMYWPGSPSTWAEAHNSFGSTVLATRWGLAEGRVGLDHAFLTYILLANPSPSAADVRVTFLRGDGSTVIRTFTVAPTSRFNVDAGTVAPELQDETFGALIEVTNGVGISVERAMYSNALGQFWAAGTNALATRLP